MKKTYSLLEYLDRHSELSKELPAVKKISFDASKFELASKSTASGSGLEPYMGTWGVEQAAHLLRRTIYGPSQTEIQEFVELGLDQSVSLLFANDPDPGEPLNPNFRDDPGVPVGASWVYKGYVRNDLRNMIRNYRRGSLLSWSVERQLNHGMSIREKMVLFWHNHLPIELPIVNDPNFVYKYISLLRSQAIGNFKQLIKDITIDPSMLRYLNGNENTKQAPNENYARELMELFTLDKGDLAGPGDYTTYTEQDVLALAKILTGWRAIGYNSLEDFEPRGQFIPPRHDTSTKQLSHRFGGIEVPNAGAEEYKNLIDIIFDRDEVAIFICKELYKWFVYYRIDPSIEEQIILPMAQLLRDNDYELAPVLEALLKSTHFYELQTHGAMIKNPMDYFIGFFNQFQIERPELLQEKYRLHREIGVALLTMQMGWYRPPGVAGWEAYYQSPTFYQYWINSVTLPIRKDLLDLVLLEGIRVGDQLLKPDVIRFMEQTTKPEDINILISEFVHVLHPRPLTEEQLSQIKEILIPGLPDFEWTEEYFIWKEDPDNEELRTLMDGKLRNVIRALIQMPEYQLS